MTFFLKIFFPNRYSFLVTFFPMTFCPTTFFPETFFPKWYFFRRYFFRIDIFSWHFFLHIFLFWRSQNDNEWKQQKSFQKITHFFMEFSSEQRKCWIEMAIGITSERYNADCWSMAFFPGSGKWQFKQILENRLWLKNNCQDDSNLSKSDCFIIYQHVVC